jgi:hypothetical protein
VSLASSFEDTLHATRIRRQAITISFIGIV